MLGLLLAHDTNGWAAPNDLAANVRDEAVIAGTPHDALFSIAIEGDRGAAVGAGGEVVETTDSGRSWRPTPLRDIPASLLGVAVRGGRAIAVGQEGVVLRSDRPGEWAVSDSQTKERLFAVAMNTAGTAFAVGSFGTVLRSNDWGASWADVAPDWSDISPEGAQPHLYDVTIDEEGIPTIVGEFGLVLRAADGHTWRVLHTGDASLFALSFRPDGTGYAVGQNGTVLRTRDSGSSWAELDAGTTAILLGVRSNSSGVVVIPGMHEFLVSSDDGDDWTRLTAEQFTSSWFQGIVHDAASQTWLVCGHGGLLIRLKAMVAGGS